MQQKKFESGGVEALRAQLGAMMRLLEQFDHHHTAQDQQLPPSYAQALMVLLTFHHEQQQPTLTDLVELLNIDKSNVTRLCQRMLEEGHIVIARDSRDRRAKRIQLSAQGVALAEAVNEVSIGRFARLSEALGGVEIVMELCARLNEALDGLVARR